MSTREWLDLGMAVIILVATGFAIYEYSRSRRSLGRFIGTVLLGLGLGIFKGLPVVYPNLAGVAETFFNLSIIGLVVLVWSWLAERRRKTE